MAAKNAQEKSRKQLYLVIGLGAVFAVLVAIQAPKLLGGGSEATPETTTGLPTTPTPTPAPGPVNASGSGAVVGGVTIVPEPTTQPVQGQLASFSLFDYHDPFVQVVKEPNPNASQDGEPAGAQASGGANAGGGSGSGTGTGTASGSGTGTGNANGGTTTVVVGPTGTTSASSGTPGASGSSGTPATAGLSAATIWVNGRDEPVEVKKRFPKTDPTFVLRELKARTAIIGVVGGSFTGSKAITLKMGQTLTLVNTATGARYTLKLLYTGAQPEQVQQFTQGQN